MSNRTEFTQAQQRLEIAVRCLIQAIDHSGAVETSIAWEELRGALDCLDQVDKGVLAPFNAKNGLMNLVNRVRNIDKKEDERAEEKSYKRKPLAKLKRDNMLDSLLSFGNK